MFSLYLLKIFEKSLSSKCLPSDWKTAFVSPVFKKGDKSLAENYRPISLTSGVCRVFEHLFADYINSCFNKINFIFRGQHGFRAGYSCESQLASLAQEISQAVDERDQIDVIFLDFKKAFDVVPHYQLCSKLANVGIDPSVFYWIQNFLFSRRQAVKVDENLSSFIEVPSGVPQGSVLGPMLYIIHSSDFHHGLVSNVRKFADDSATSKKIRDVSDCILLQKDLDRIEIWCILNGMTLSIGKCQIVSFCNKHEKIIFDYKINGESIPRTDSALYLGVIFSEHIFLFHHR